MKKFLSVFLSVVLIFSAVSIGVSAAKPEADLKFAVASDLHYNVPVEELEGEIDDEIYWYANRRAAMEPESSWIIDEFLNQCAENDDVDFVLISGDIADNGKSIAQEHYDMAAKFAAFEEKCGKQIYVTVGNHDAGVNCETELADFKEIYADFGYDKALVVSETDCSYTADLGDKYRLIALDSTAPDKSTADGMSAEKIDWVRVQAQQAKKDGRYPIMMMHHNLLDHMPVQSIFSQDFIVKFHYSTADLFANWGIKLVFSGHEHCSDAATYTSTAGNVIYDFATTSLTMYPLQYRTFKLTDETIAYKDETVDKIDTDSLTAYTAGYDENQIALMNAGLNDYAKGFLKAGIKYRLGRSLSMEKMGIAEDAFYYDLVNVAVGGLNKLLNDPLYGEGGIQQLAAEYNIDIPDSRYKNGWDVVTELVAAHYEGEESFDFSTKEVTIFLRLVALLLKDDLATVADEVFFDAANELFAHFGTDSAITDLTKLATKVFGGVTPAEYFLIAFVSPLVYNFAVDNDGVNDNRGSLPGYGVVSVEQNSYNILDRIHTTLNNVMKYITMFLQIVLKIFIK